MWYQKIGNENDVAVSSRVRLARNLAGYPFGGHLSAEQEKEIIVRRYVQGERVEDVYESLSISRATAFRRLEAGIMHLAGMYNKFYDAVA